MSSYFLNRFLDFHRAPFTLLALLACAAACGSAFAQSASGDSQQTSQSNPATPNGEFMPVQPSDRGYVGAYLGDLNAERARDLGLKEIRGAVVGRVEESSPALTSIVCSSIHNRGAPSRWGSAAEAPSRD
jgi:hypothetical protein